MVTLICAIVGVAKSMFPVDIDTSQLVGHLKEAIKAKKSITLKDVEADMLQLFLAKTPDGEWLKGYHPAVLGLKISKTHPDIQRMLDGEEMSPIWSLQHWLFEKNNMPQPSTGKIHVLVVLPAYNANAAWSQLLPMTTKLAESEKLAAECLSLHEWDVCVVHRIPFICKFMSNLGGCTDTGEIFYRMEDKQIVSLVLDGWFGKSSLNNVDRFERKKSIVVGSPGIGKSTLLCVMAFHLVFRYNKNVLVFRRVRGYDSMSVLFYLGYENGVVVHFSVQMCDFSVAIDIYHDLLRQQDVSKVWLLLDGFRYRDIPHGRVAFKMLATSQQVDLKSDERNGAQVCLLPCWSKKDLLLVGHLIYKYLREDMKDRFFYSGGSVREFTRATSMEIRNAIDRAIVGVDDIPNLLSDSSCVVSGSSQVDHLRHTFVARKMDCLSSFTFVRRWVQVIDSEYAVYVLALKLRLDALSQIFTWARSVGNGSLASTVFENYLHRLAADNRLELHVSKYDPQARMRPNEPRYLQLQRVKLHKGIAMCSGTASEYEKILTYWRDDSKYSYWFPQCHTFPNINSIVKFEDGNVAYLQITVAERLRIESKQLEEVNAIFLSAGYSKPPIYIFVCPDKESCEALVLPEAVEVKTVCEVYVGYYAKLSYGTGADGPMNNVLSKKDPPPPPQKLRKRRREEKS